MPFIAAENKRILFVHIPRTGGTALESSLREIAPVRLHTVGQPPALRCTPQHLRKSDIDMLFGENYFDYSFAIVRNPYDKIESEYRLHCAIQRSSVWGSPLPFSLWLEQQLTQATNNSWHGDNHFRPQWEFVDRHTEIFDHSNGLGPAIAKVCWVLGLDPIGEPERALSEKREVEESPITWSRADEIRVEEFYARDFSEFSFAKRER